MCSVSLMPVFNHLCKVRCWMLNTVYLTVYLSFQVLCLLLNSLLLILKMNLKDYVQNLTESEWKVSETCVLASLNRAKEIWKVMQGKWLHQYFRLFLCKKLKGFSLSWRTPNGILLHRYWWNTRIFPLTKKSYLHRAQWKYYFYLSRVRILVSPWLLTWLANYKRASRSGTRPVLLLL